MLVGVVLYWHGSILLPCLLTYLFCTVEDSTHKRNRLRGVFFLEDQGITFSFLYVLTCSIPHFTSLFFSNAFPREVSFLKIYCLHAFPDCFKESTDALIQNKIHWPDEICNCINLVIHTENYNFFFFKTYALRIMVFIDAILDRVLEVGTMVSFDYIVPLLHFVMLIYPAPY